MNRFILILLLATVLLSCKKSSSPAPTPKKDYKSLIIGKWYYTLDTLKENTNGGAFKILSTLSGYDRTFYSQFNSDGTGVEFYNGSSPFTYSISGNVITYNFPAQTIALPGGSVTDPAFTKTATIRSVTADQLSILYYDTTVVGNTTTVDYEAVYYSK